MKVTNNNAYVVNVRDADGTLRMIAPLATVEIDDEVAQKLVDAKTLDREGRGKPASAPTPPEGGQNGGSTTGVDPADMNMAEITEELKALGHVPAWGAKKADLVAQLTEARKAV